MKTKVLVDGLKKLSADLVSIADMLEDSEAPEAGGCTLEEVRGILAEKSRAGYRAEVKAILTAHGADKLSEITDPAVLEAIAREAGGIGNG